MADHPEREMEPIEIPDIFGGDENTRKKLEEIFTKVKTPAFSGELDFTRDADEDQLAFIQCDSSTIRLLAPAGSGKTQSIANRLLHHCTQGNGSLDRSLVLTFDNAAASSLRTKLQNAIQASGISVGSPSVFTLNSFGYRLLQNELRENVNKHQMGANPVNEAREIVREILRQLRKGAPAKANLLPRRLAARVYVDLIGVLKNEIVLADDLADQSPEAIEAFLGLAEQGVFDPWLEGLDGPDAAAQRRTILNLIVHVYREYEHELLRRDRIDFDDQKLLPYLALRDNSRLVNSIMARYRAVIVDEFQDINRLDFELIQTLAATKQLIVVGDDDQAIYGFRGCSPDYIINFTDRSGREADTLVLRTNYRCPRNIIEMGNTLIAHNKFRVDKTQTANKQYDADVQLWHSVNCASEAQVITRFVKRIFQKERENGFRYSDVAILYRINSQSLPIQIALAIEGIPFHCRPEDNILLSQTMTNLLGLIHIHLDLQKNVDYYGSEAAELIARCMTQRANHQQIRRFGKSVEKCGSFVRAADSQGKVYMFGGLLKHWQFVRAILALSAPASSPSDLIKRITGNFNAIYGIIGTLEEALNDEVPLAEVLDISGRFRGSVEDFYKSLTELVNAVQSGLFADADEDGVNLLTYFRAKGLQWHTVIIPTANQRIIPHSGSPLEDERRLFYVAVTRAQTNLIVSYVRQAVDTRVARSQFVSEMGLSDAVEKRARSLG